MLAIISDMVIPVNQFGVHICIVLPSDTCYGTRNSCPSTSITTCNHNEDITVTCSKLLYQAILKIIIN